MLRPGFVIATHDEIIAELGGLAGFAQGGPGGVEAALQRIVHHTYYAGLDDAFSIAALYGVAIARGHVFNDGNKRTGLACALAYLEQQEIRLPTCEALEEVMVDVARGRISEEVLASVLYSLWDLSKKEHLEVNLLSQGRTADAEGSRHPSADKPRHRSSRR